nr:hypothetical protein CFP56_55886 [Quercus suber]POF02056.1 hypothetical protein CFP56_18180 [Quercus suber]POF14761.1 hypothetical protein CFP56_43608 [Quercus suber]
MLCLSLRNADFGYVLLMPNRVSTTDHELVMAPKRGKRGKSKAASKPKVVFDQLRFNKPENEQTFETLIKHRRIWGERQINLHELHPSVYEKLQSRHWLSLCTNIEPPPAELIREFYSNLSVHEECGGHTVASWIRGEQFTITRAIVAAALDVPRIRTPTYPYSVSPRIDDVMNVLCGRSVTRVSNRSISSSELTELNYIFFRIACHNIFPISHIHTIPIDRCFFLYALITDSSICFPSLFIETIVEVRRSKYKRHGLFFPVLIHRVLKYLGLRNFPSQEVVHIQAPIGTNFLKQRSAQKKFAEPSVGSPKRPRVQSTTGDDVPYEDMHGDPTAAVVEDGDDEVDVDTTAAAQTGPPPPSLRAMMETIMTTQATHGQVLYGLLADIAALRADVADFRRQVPPSPSSDSS